MLSTLFDWTKRMALKWLWLLALVPAFADFVATFIPDDSIPPQAAAWLALIGTWQATAVFATVGFVWAAFLVHRDICGEVQRLKQALDEAANAVPRFQVGLKSGSEPATNTPVIRLPPLPEMEDVDALVEKERESLNAAYAAAQQTMSSNTSAGAAALMAAIGLERLNPNYEEEVDDYLKKFREYLACRRQSTLAKTRLRRLEIAVANTGIQSASNVHVELRFPKGWLLDEETERQLLMVESDDYDYCQKATRPEPITAGWAFRLDTNSSFSYLQDLGHLPQVHVKLHSPQIDIDHAARTACFTLKEVTPQQRLMLNESIIVWLGHVRESTTAVIEYTVYAAQLRTPQDGKIEVQIVVERADRHTTMTTE